MTIICPPCQKPWVVSTSPTTGCCDGERYAAWCALMRHLNCYKRVLEEATIRAAEGWSHESIREVTQSALRWGGRTRP